MAGVIVDGVYYLPPAALAVPEVAIRVAQLILPTAPLPDALAWLHMSDDKLTSKTSFNFLLPAAVSLPWAAAIWKSCIPPPPLSFIYSLAHHAWKNANERKSLSSWLYHCFNL